MNISLIYPLFKTVKVLQEIQINKGQLKSTEIVNVVCFWFIVGIWAFIESINFIGFFLSWLPLYNVIKTCVYGWLISDVNSGAASIYYEHIHSSTCAFINVIDNIFNVYVKTKFEKLTQFIEKNKRNSD